MTLAWLLFAFVGLFTARYMRQVWEPTKLLGEKAWFTVSNYIQNIITLIVNSNFNILSGLWTFLLVLVFILVRRRSTSLVEFFKRLCLPHDKNNSVYALLAKR